MPFCQVSRLMTVKSGPSPASSAERSLHRALVARARPASVLAV